MENLIHDLRFGLRTLLKNPGFTAVAIITLALGTGVNSAIFSVVNALLLRPLPYAQPDRLALIWGKTATSSRDAISYPDFREYRDQSQLLEQLATFAYDDFTITSGDEPEHVQGAIVSANYFEMLGINFTRGRGFRLNEDQAGAERVVIVSDALWKSRFGSDPNLIGQTIQLNGGPFTVVGIAPPSFQSPFPEDKPQLWTPFSFDGADRLRLPSNISPEGLNDRKNRFLVFLGRVKQGVTISQAQTELENIAAALERQYQSANSGLSVNVVPLHEQFVGKIQTALVVLLAAVGFVLLIACANVANLLLARSAARQREIAIRAALGAGRARLIRQLLTESILLSVVGGALGLLLAYGEIKLLLSLNPPNIPRLGEVDIDALVLAFTFLIAILTGVIFGLAPALQVSRPDLNETLKEGARGSTGGVGGQRLRSLLVVSEVALTVLLLIAAGLMMKSFYALQNVNPGFHPESVMTMMVNLPTSKYTDDHQIASF